MDDFPPSAIRLIEKADILRHKKLIDENWEIFLHVLRFLTKKIYRTPGL